jgi:hypothetical protein
MAATPAALSSAGRIAGVAALIFASGPCLLAGSAGRSATTTATPGPSTRLARYASQRSDAGSAQWASSTVISTGWPAAMFTVSQYKPCTTANGSGAASGAPSSPRTAAAGPASHCVRWGGSATASSRSNSWRTTPKAKPVSSSEPVPRSTRQPLRAARSLPSRSSDVLPMPAPPSMTRTPPVSSTVSRARSSSARSSSTHQR